MQHTCPRRRVPASTASALEMSWMETPASHSRGSLLLAERLKMPLFPLRLSRGGLLMCLHNRATEWERRPCSAACTLMSSRQLLWTLHRAQQGWAGAFEGLE